MAFAPTKGKKHLRKQSGELSLTSMMDMMTIILLFLLKSFSTSGALMQQSKFVDNLPYSVREVDPKKGLQIVVNKSQGVILGDTEVAEILSPANELNDPDMVVLAGLQRYLDEQRERSMRLPTGFNGSITIQCDSAVTYDWLLKVINTCGQTEFANIDFVVIKKG